MQTQEIDPKAAKYGPIVAKVNSMSEPDKMHEVRRGHDGKLTCQCFGWRFSGKNGATRGCKHTKAFEKNDTSVLNATGVTVKPAQAGVPQYPKAIHDEAVATADYILALPKGQARDRATARIEQAIKKFLGTLAAQVVEAFEETSTGYRMITLDE